MAKETKHVLVDATTHMNIKKLSADLRISMKQYIKQLIDLEMMNNDLS